MRIIDKYSFLDILHESWGSATDILEKINKWDMGFDFLCFLDDMYQNENPTMTEVNDFIIYDCSFWLQENYSIHDIDDFDELCDFFNDCDVDSSFYVTLNNIKDMIDTAIDELFDTLQYECDTIQDCIDYIENNY